MTQEEAPGAKPGGVGFRSEFCLASSALLQGCTRVEDGQGAKLLPCALAFWERKYAGNPSLPLGGD